MIHVILPLIILGLIVQFFRRYANLPAKLPSHRLTHAREITSAGWTWEYTPPTFSLFTQAFNNLPRSLVPSSKSRFATALTRFYDIGTVIGVCGGIAGVGALTWATVDVWRMVWEEGRAHASWSDSALEGVKLAKRAQNDFGVEGGSSEVGSSGLRDTLQPLIPGVTMPFSHLPTLILALVVFQLFHEFGHALCAVLDDITPSRLSFNVHVVIPSMIVTFPLSIDSLPAWSKMRIATSGSWHNLLTYFTIGTMTLSGLGKIFWTDISDHGRVVQAVRQTSPLYSHLRPGTLLSYIDDQFMGGDEDIWERYLSSDEVGDAGQGWCIDKATFTALPEAPCANSQDIKFTQIVPTLSHQPLIRCLAPHPILDIPSTPCGCPSKWMCVRPSPEEGILRIQMGREGVLLWAGDRKGVLDGVEIGRESVRFASMGLGGVLRWGTMFLQYASNVALSLFFFNLLPLPHTDGSALLKSLLQNRRKPTPSATAPQSLRATLSSPSQNASPRINLDAYKEYELNSDEDEDDEEVGRSLRTGTRRREIGWRRRLRRGVEVGCVALGVGWFAGWIIVALLRSS